MVQQDRIREMDVEQQEGRQVAKERGCLECERLKVRVYELKSILDGTLQGVADLVLRYVVPNYIAPELRIKQDGGMESRFREMFRPVSDD